MTSTSIKKTTLMTLLMGLSVVVGGPQAGTIEERIYVGEVSPNHVHSFSFNGLVFTREDLDSSDADPISPLVSSFSFSDLQTSNGSFLLGHQSPSLGFGALDLATASELPRPTTSIGDGYLQIHPLGDFAILINDTGSVSLSVIDLRPAVTTYLEEIATLSIPGGGRAIRHASVFGPDGSTLYIGLSRGGFGVSGADGKIVAVDFFDPTAPFLIPGETLFDPPSWGNDELVRSLRVANIGGTYHLLVMRFQMLIFEIGVSGELTYKMRFGSQSVDVPDPGGGNERSHNDAFVIDTVDGPRGIVATLTSDQADYSWQSARVEMLVVDLSGVLTDDTSGTRLIRNYNLTSLADPSCGSHGVVLEPSADGQHAFRLDECDSNDRARLYAIDLERLLDGSPNPVDDEITVDEDLSLAKATARAMIVTEQVTALPGPGPVISGATVDGGMLLMNDLARQIEVSGSNLASTAHAFLAGRKISLDAVSPDFVQVTSPSLVPSGDQTLGLIDSLGRVGLHSGLRVVNPPAFLPENVTFATSQTNEVFRLNSSTQSTAAEAFDSVQSPWPALVSKDGKRLYVGGFRDGTVSVYCAVAETGVCDWNEEVTNIFVGGQPTDIVESPSGDRIFVTQLFPVGISVIDTTVDPPILVDTDGDPGTTDDGFPAGVTAIHVNDGWAGAWTLAVHPSGGWLYATSYRQSFIYAFRLGSHLDPDLVEPADIIGTDIPDLGTLRIRSDGLAVSPDGTRLYFTNYSDSAVRVFSIDGADGSLLTPLEQVAIPSASGWESRTLAVHPDSYGSFLYVSSSASGVTDIFEYPAPACVTPPCYNHLATVPTGGESRDPVADPAGEYLYVASQAAGGVVGVDLRVASPTRFQVLSITGTGLAGATSVGISPGLLTPACAQGVCVTMEPSQGVEITFDEVSGDGNTSVTSANVTDVPLNDDYLIEGLPVFYDISTDATVAGLIDICFDYDDTNLSASQEAEFKLLHQQADASCDPPGSECFIDVTSAGFPDTVNNKLCGEVSDFSQFVPAVDLATGPSNPDTFIFSHNGGSWSTDTTIDVDWSGAAQHPSGQSLAGYSIETTVSSGTQPDTAVDVVHGADPHQQVLGPLTDGPWSFHLRTCTTDDFCSSSVHFGPFGIDTSPPFMGSSPLSSSHAVGAPSTVDTLDFNWAAAIDPFSGVAGYAWEVDQSSSWICDETTDGDDQTLTASVGPLGTGSYFAHVCAVDAVGSWSVVTTSGPFTIDVSGPRILTARTVAGDPGGFVTPGARVSDPITQVLLHYDETMQIGGGVGDVTSVAEYLLVRPGPDGDFATSDCASGASGDDIAVPLSVMGFDSLNDTVALSNNGGTSLLRGLYRLYACGTLADTLGNQLDGDDNGGSGSDFVLGFEVIGTNLLRNPNFDNDLGNWATSSILPGEITAGSDDAGDAFSSGSARLEDIVGKGAPLSLSQCVPVGVDPAYSLGARVRVASLSGSDPQVVGTVIPFPAPLCSGSAGTLITLPLPSGDTSGSWIIAQGQAALPPGTASALVILASNPGATSGSVVDLDSVFLANLSDAIFSDGFESGTVAEWTSSTR